MKREIKFRGRSETGRWVYGDLINGINHVRIRHSVSYAEDPNAKHAESFIEEIVDKETVGQFTGLKDKNGAEIYEGDILQMWLDDSVEPNGGLFHQMYVVFTVEKGFVLWGKNMTTEDSEPLFEMLQWKDCEIISNTHDNPNLLK